MDNVTHSLAGMLLAEAACELYGARPEVRPAAYWTSALASNLPDIDVVYSSLLGPPPLGSLLHHRGHTHTLLLALPAAWLLGWLAFRGFSRRHPNASARERQLLVLLSLVGATLHLLMDFGNNYGVHPFWPLSGKWFYGDYIFIVEPLWLAIAIPVLTATIERRWFVWLLWGLLGLLLLVCWFVPFVATPVRFALFGITALSTFAARRTSSRARIAFALAGWLTVAAVFVAGSRQAKARARDAATAAFPALTLDDIAVAPLPANPTCWEALLAGQQGGSYRVVRATVALPPTRAEDCGAGLDVEPSAPMHPLDRPSRGGVRWVSEYRADLAALTRLRRDDCRFRALLRFARLPYVTASGELSGDLRYDRNPGPDFSDVALRAAPPQRACPSFVPGWREPRAELFAR